MAELENKDPSRVRSMFDRISGRYDLLNHLLSLNQDRRWRKAAVRPLAGERLPRVLDLCGGTGDLSVELARAEAARTVICCDFSHAMLHRAGPKFERFDGATECVRLEADGLKLPLESASIDAVTVGFGVRNFADMSRGFREIHRVLRPGGRLIVLEFSQPTGWLARPYQAYLRFLLPRVGAAVSGRLSAYAYLARTIAGFPAPETLAGMIREAGFAGCGWSQLTSGIVAVHSAFRGPAAAGSVGSEQQ